MIKNFFWMCSGTDTDLLQICPKSEPLNMPVLVVFKTLGIHQELPHVNKISKTNYRDFYDEETQKIIADWFHEDIQDFNYKY